MRYFKNRENTDWELRKKELLKIIEKNKHKKNYYDCIVPSSGGKDSTYQVLKVKNWG